MSLITNMPSPIYAALLAEPDTCPRCRARGLSRTTVLPGQLEIVRRVNCFHCPFEADERFILTTIIQKT